MSCFWLLIIISQNQKSTNFIIIIIVVVIIIVAVAVVVVMIIIMMNNAVADQKWIDFFMAIQFGEIAKVKMLFEANRWLFLNSAFPDYGWVWIPLTSSSSSSLSSSLSWSSFIWFHSFIHSFAIWWWPQLSEGEEDHERNDVHDHDVDDNDEVNYSIIWWW